jgi:hypothetical protein
LTRCTAVFLILNLQLCLDSYGPILRGLFIHLGTLASQAPKHIKVQAIYRRCCRRRLTERRSGCDSLRDDGHCELVRGGSAINDEMEVEPFSCGKARDFDLHLHNIQLLTQAKPLIGYSHRLPSTTGVDSVLFPPSAIQTSITRSFHASPRCIHPTQYFSKSSTCGTQRTSLGILRRPLRRLDVPGSLLSRGICG